MKIIKRDGRIEDYDSNKLMKVSLWACNNDKSLANILINSLNLKINQNIDYPISRLYDELIETSVNSISPIQRLWDNVASRLYLMKIYKETYNLKNTGYYPDYKEVIKVGIKNNIYDPKVFESFTDDEINELGSIINPDNDLLFTYKGLYIMYNKYCLRSLKNNIFELPQHVYLRTAIFSFYKEPKDIRMKLIKQEYNIWSNHLATPSTPRILNSSTTRPQLASCVLSTVDDDTESLVDTFRNLAKYSKFGGGLALDISRIRASGSPISSNGGISNGPIPFVKVVEGVVSAWNQNGKRAGACVISYPFWHYDVLDLLPLNDAGGTEDNRARKLKYSIKLNNLFMKRCLNNENVTLFNPTDVPLLNSTYGDEFEANYLNYEKLNNIRKKSVPAKELLFNFIKYRKETGNLYATFVDNINNQSPLYEYIGSSNLCQEITIPSNPSKGHSTQLITEESGITKIVETKDSGEIGLCNLLSINLSKWIKLSDHEKSNLIRVLVRGADNIIDYQFYPVKEAKFSNINKRPIGIGVNNYANCLALSGIKFTDESAKKFTHELFEEVYYLIYKHSNLLAKDRGPFNYFRNTKWSKGFTPVSASLLANLDRHDLNYEYKYDWDKLSRDIKKYGVRFSFHGAIAPTATSGKVISATESCDPIIDHFYIEEGTQSLPSLLPNLELREFYEKGWDIPTKTIIELASIRQKFIDQSQSLTFFYKKPDSAKELAQDIFYAMKLGIKTIYYMKTPKSNYTDVCESCT